MQRLDYDYCEDTETEQIGGVHNLIRGLIQHANTDTVIGYDDRIGQMIMSGPASRHSVVIHKAPCAIMHYTLCSKIDLLLPRGFSL
jgi:hypothetical protein